MLDKLLTYHVYCDSSLMRPWFVELKMHKESNPRATGNFILRMFQPWQCTLATGQTDHLEINTPVGVLPRWSSDSFHLGSI